MLETYEIQTWDNDEGIVLSTLVNKVLDRRSLFKLMHIVE